MKIYFAVNKKTDETKAFKNDWQLNGFVSRLLSKKREELSWAEPMRLREEVKDEWFFFATEAAELVFPDEDFWDDDLVGTDRKKTRRANIS